MLHKWCFKTKNPILKAFGVSFSVSLFTDTNRYDLGDDTLESKVGERQCVFKVNSLSYAGGQLYTSGKVTVKVNKNDNKISFAVDATMDEPINKIKITLFDRNYGKIIGRRRYDLTPSKEGMILNYPNGWDDLYTPLICIQKAKGFDYYRMLDKNVTPKHFAIQEDGNKKLTIELVYEEDASKCSTHASFDGFEIGEVDKMETIYEDQRLFIEKAYHLVRWEDRKDVPDWAKKMTMMISIHGMHWSGYIFNTYKDIEDKLEWLKDYCDPTTTCIYIPGFDGRYYYKYPYYDPDERMGGEEGLKSLMKHAHKLGFHIMPMFMSNGGNPNLYEDFLDIMNESRYHSRNGFVHGVGSCDWDTGRGYDLGCGVGVNPGAPKWQDFIVNEICRQIEKFDFDAIFLDLAAIYHNDPFFSTHKGAIAIIDRIHEKFPNVLVATEGCYDALSISFPLSQCAADGSRGLEMIYHDTPYAPLFDTYNRCVGHLCLGTPGDMKTGVFESGFNYAETRMPLRKGIIPTLSLVDDTIEKYPEEVKDILRDSKKYKKMFLEDSH